MGRNFCLKRCNNLQYKSERAEGNSHHRTNLAASRRFSQGVSVHPGAFSLIPNCFKGNENWMVSAKQKDEKNDRARFRHKNQSFAFLVFVGNKKTQIQIGPWKIKYIATGHPFPLDGMSSLHRKISSSNSCSLTWPQRRGTSP